MASSDTASETEDSDLDQRLAKWRKVEMPFDDSAFSPREKQMVAKLVEASQYIGTVFWLQNDPEGLELYKSLSQSTNPRDEKLRRLLMIHGGRFDLIDEHRSFVGEGKIPPGRALYPEGLSAKDIEDYVRDRPEKRKEIYSPYTVVERQGDELIGKPYHEVYRSWLEPAAQALRDAADLSDEPQFAEFLRKRADALLTDDYYESDLLWVDLHNPKFDVIFAPYETYLDDLLGVKASYGPAVLIRNEAESQNLAMFQQYIPVIQDALPLAEEFRNSKKDHVTPMEVMDAPFRAGDLRHGYQAVADNLPNDPRIQKERGTKKIFFKNFMDARIRHVVLPLANRLMAQEQTGSVTGGGYMTGTLWHENAHDMGVAFASVAGKETDIREALGSLYTETEEAKADVMGMFAVKILADLEVLPEARLEEYYASFIADFFRSLRFGAGESHSRAAMMEFNYLWQEKAIVQDADGRYRINCDLMPAAFTELTRELLAIEVTGDRKRAEDWFNKYGTMPDHLKKALETVTDIPVDIDPVVAFSPFKI